MDLMKKRTSIVVQKTIILCSMGWNKYVPGGGWYKKLTKIHSTGQRVPGNLAHQTWDVPNGTLKPPSVEDL